MTTYVVTTANWDDPGFWNTIVEGLGGHTLDFSSLPSNFTVDIDKATGRIIISDGATTFTVGEAGYGGTSDATLGGGTLWDFFETLTFGDGSHNVEGDFNPEAITTAAGDDSIFSGAGNDTIDAGDGNNVVYAGTDNDIVNSGSGADQIFGEDGLDTINSGGGDDYVDGGGGADSITGGAGADQLEGGWTDSASDTIRGGDGNDLIFGGGGADSIYGENDFDWIDGGWGADFVDGGSGNDRIVGDKDNDSILGGAGVDILTGGAGADTLRGGDDQDAIYGAAGDVIDGGEGGADNDTLYVGDVASISYSTAESGTVFFNAGGSLTFSNIENVVTNTHDGIVQGTAGADQIGQFYFDADGEWIDNDDAPGGGEADSVLAGAGDDTVWANEGNDTVLGGDGNDSLYLGDGNDTVYGGDGDLLTADDASGNDTMNLAAGDDLAFGEAGNDVIYGDDGTDTISGNEGADELSGGDGNDSLQGGQGNDTISGGNDADNIIGDGQWYNPANYASGPGVTATNLTVTNSADGPIDLWWIDGTGTPIYYATIAAGDSYVQPTFEDHNWLLRDEDGYYLELIAGAPNQTVNYGAEGLDDSIDGGAGNDSILGQFGDDTIGGGAGVDTILGGSGGDSIDGGDGSDFIEGGDGNDVIEAGSDLGDNNDTVYGGAGDDTITSSSTDFDSDDILDGGTGNDSIVGSGGADTITGGTGDDSLAGGQDWDTIVGGQGDDTIDGGSHNDLLYGDHSDPGSTYYITDIGELYLYEPGTGTSTLLHTGLEPYGDIATGPDGTIYGVVFDEAAASDAGIYRIDPDTGTETLVIDLPEGTEFHASLAADSAGNLYVNDDLTGNITRYEPDGFGGFTSAGSVGTIVVDAKDIVFIDDSTAWATANGDIYQYDVDGSGNFSNEVNLGTINVGQVDIFGLSLSEDGTVYAYEGSGEVWSTDPGVQPLVWSAEAATDLGTGVQLWGTAQLAFTGGNDSIDGGSGDDTIFGGAGNDTLTAGNNTGAGDSLVGGDGDDVITDSFWNATLEGGDGADLFNVGYGTATVSGGEGGTDNDTLSFAVANDPANVTLNADEAGFYNDNDGDSGIFSGIEAFELTSGNDTLDAGGDTTGIEVYAGDGADSISGGSGNDSIDGDGGNDTLRGGQGSDTITGGDGQNYLYGNEGNDSLIGSNTDIGGFTEMQGGDGADTLDGTAGDWDIAQYYNSADAVDVDLTDGLTETGGEAQGDTLMGIEQIDGSNLGNDTIVGDAGVYEVKGWGGDDELTLNSATGGIAYGGDGSDTITGTAGDDTLDGDDNLFTGGADSILAGAGNDEIIGDAGNDSLYGEAGNDTIYAGDGSDYIDGGTDADVLYGQNDGDTFRILDSSGNDTIIGGEGITTGSDQDSINAFSVTSGVDVTFDGAETGDLTFGATSIDFSEIEHLTLTDQNDTVNATANTEAVEVWAYGGNDSVAGGSGNDTLYGMDGADTLAGGSGNDLLDGGAGNDDLYGGAGNDTLQGGAGFDEYFFADGWGSDTVTDATSSSLDFGSVTTGITFTATGADAFSATDGTNTVSGTTGTFSSISLSQGNDYVDLSGMTANTIQYIYGDYSGAADTDTIIGSDLDDQVYVLGDNGQYLVNFGGGNDYIEATDQNDTVFGEDGNDSLRGFGGNDYLDGGAGDDQFFNSEGNNTLIGGAGDDYFFADFGSNQIYGGTGNDTVEAGDGDDTIFVEDAFGNDLIQGGETAEINGDILDASAVTTDTTLDLTAGGAADPESGTLSDGTSTATFSEIESIILGSGNDIVIGSSGADNVDAGAGNDFFSSGDGDDLLVGGLGNDTFFSGAGADTMLGGDGNDLITQSSNDSIDGGDGIDTLDSNFGTFDDVYTFTTATGGVYNAATSGGGTFENMEVFLSDGGAETYDASLATSDLTFSTGAGNDTITGGSGNDQIDGGGEDDTFIIEDGFGNDTITGGETGETSGDTLDASAVTANTTLDLSAGGAADPDSGTLTDGTSTAGFSEIETVTLGSGDDSVTGSSGNDSVSTGAGSDTVNGGAGNDSFDVGAGDGAVDTVVMSDGDGDDTITGFEGPIDNGDGTFTGQDQLDLSGMTDAGGALLNTRDVTVGDDGFGNAVLSFPNGDSITLVGIAPADVTDEDALAAMGIAAPNEIVEGTAGADLINTSYVGDPEGDRVDAGDNAAGNDDDSITAGDGNDTVAAGAGNDTVLGEAGADSIGGGTGDDSIDGGIGDDWLDGSADNDTVSGGDGADSVYGGAGNDSLLGGAGNDSMEGWLGNDTMDGGADNDYIDGADGNDILIGGTGNDTLLGGNDTGADSLDGGAGDDDLSAGDGADTLVGGTGADSMFGAGGDDVFVIEDDFGNDTINGWSTNETGGDSIDAGAVTQDLTLDLSQGSASDPESGTLSNGTQTATFSEIENITLGSGNDSVTGSTGGDTVNTGAGNDTVNAGDGGDSIDGGAGDDSIFVDQGDTVSGGDGDDFFILQDLDTSGTGNDSISITGGEGGETNGDTLQLTPDVSLADITFSNTDDAAGGLSGSFAMADGTVVSFSEIENIICFTPGTKILTGHGERDIETLQVGDLVVTRDHGLRPIRWIGKRTVQGTGRFAPVWVGSDVMDGARTGLLVSPQHRILFTGYRAELLFGESEVLVPAKHLIDGRDVVSRAQDEVTYIHIMFDRHEVIYAEGIATESFHAGDVGLGAICEEAREELFAIFPELRSAPGHHRDTARVCLKKHEAQLLARDDDAGPDFY